MTMSIHVKHHCSKLLYYLRLVKNIFKFPQVFVILLQLINAMNKVSKILLCIAKYHVKNTLKLSVF